MSARVGEWCASSADCGGLECISSYCRLPRGAPCDGLRASSCTSDQCVAGNYGKGSCEAILPFEIETCHYDSQCALWSDASRCSHKCQNTACVAECPASALAVGAVCEHDAECLSDHCVNGVCWTVGETAACLKTVNCASGLECVNHRCLRSVVGVTTNRRRDATVVSISHALCGHEQRHVWCGPSGGQGRTRAAVYSTAAAVINSELVEPFLHRGVRDVASAFCNGVVGAAQAVGNLGLNVIEEFVTFVKNNFELHLLKFELDFNPAAGAMWVKAALDMTVFARFGFNIEINLYDVLSLVTRALKQMGEQILEGIKKVAAFLYNLAKKIVSALKKE